MRKVIGLSKRMINDYENKEMGKNEFDQDSI